MQNIYIFFYAQECWTFILLKYKNKIKKHTHNTELLSEGVKRFHSHVILQDLQQMTRVLLHTIL